MSSVRPSIKCQIVLSCTERIEGIILNALTKFHIFLMREGGAMTTWVNGMSNANGECVYVPGAWELARVSGHSFRGGMPVPTDPDEAVV
jgi:hypothetical protein